MTPSLGAIRSPSSCIVSALAFSLLLLLLPLHARAQEAVTADAGAPPDDTARVPSVEWQVKRLSCVPYARLRSGLAIFGDAKLWWARAKSLYEEFAQPAVDAVMVFSGSKRIRRGHVAVVTEIVSPREIVIDHANWQNKGEIDHNMPVLDVSPNNDWSQVRVWDVNNSRFGAHVYRISGFILGNRPVMVAAGS